MEILNETIKEIQKTLHLTNHGTFFLCAFEEDVVSEVWRENLQRENPSYLLYDISQRCIKLQEEIHGRKPNWEVYYTFLDAYGITKDSPRQDKEFVKKLLAPKKEFKKPAISTQRPPVYDLLEAFRFHAFLKEGYNKEFFENVNKFEGKRISGTDSVFGENIFIKKCKRWAKESLLPLFDGKNGNFDIVLGIDGCWNIFCSNNKITQEDYMSPFLEVLPPSHIYPLKSSAKTTKDLSTQIPFEGKIKILIENNDVDILFAVKQIDKTTHIQKNIV